MTEAGPNTRNTFTTSEGKVVAFQIVTRQEKDLSGIAGLKIPAHWATGARKVSRMLGIIRKH